MHGAWKIGNLLRPLPCPTCRKKSQVILQHLRHTVWDPLPPSTLTPLPVRLPLPPHIQIWPSMKKMIHCLRIFTSPRNLFDMLVSTRKYDRLHGTRDPATRRRATPRYLPPSPPDMNYYLPLTGLSGTISIFTDGSALDNGLETCTAGAAWTSNYFIRDYCKLTGYTLTNNIAETAAVIMALISWRGHDIHIFTDSTFVLGLINGGLLAMERDGWPNFPWLHAITPARQYSTLFKYLLFLLRAHGGLIDFSKVKAHDDCTMNNIADRLANLGRTEGRIFDLGLLVAPPNWINDAPVLNNASLSDLSALVIRHRIPAPIFSPKVTLPLGTWRLHIFHKYQINIEPIRYIPGIWRLHIWATLKETIWKHLFSSLPLGRRCYSSSDLGRYCRCGTIMSVDHMWASCPAYNLRPLIDVTNTQLASITPGLYVKHTDLDGSCHQWMVLLTLTHLDRAIMPSYHQKTL